MSGLHQYNPCWEVIRAQGSENRVLEDDSILIATDFEGGNGADLRRLEQDYYAIRLEPEPGKHAYSGKAYYFCFGIRNKRSAPRSVRLRIEAYGWDGKWAEQTRHVVLRRGGRWYQLNPAHIHPVEGMADTINIELPLPGADEPDNTIFASNFHWWPYSEMVQYLQTLNDAQVIEIGRSFQNRPIYAVELGSDDNDALCMIHAQTPQPSEMGSLACRAMIDFLCSDAPDAVEIRNSFRIYFIPMTNPDGTVLGYAVSDAQGRFPYFEGNLAASGNSDATPETSAVWQYLQEQRPLLFWEWHSNNWSRRPGHMLLRYKHEMLEDELLKRIWVELDRRLLDLPNTHHGNWTSRTEGFYQNSMGFQAVTRLGAISCMIKQHDKYPLEQSHAHAIACLKAAANVFQQESRWT